ncbi:MAG: hypothetical protein IKN30_06210 [Synergistaceae bacterium]|nr:hypothetical protein [Synergistaceae bacterium]
MKRYIMEVCAVLLRKILPPKKVSNIIDVLSSDGTNNTPIEPIIMEFENDVKAFEERRNFYSNHSNIRTVEEKIREASVYLDKSRYYHSRRCYREAYRLARFARYFVHKLDNPIRKEVNEMIKCLETKLGERLSSIEREAEESNRRREAS